MTGMIICFGDCELDAERRQLRRNGKLVSVEPRVFDLLVEVIRSEATSDEAMKIAFELCTALGKTAVESADRPGFIANRVLMPMINEAIFAVMEGVGTPGAIDTVMKLGMNHPMGPLTLAGFIGLDVCLAIMNVLRDGLRSRDRRERFVRGSIRRALRQRRDRRDASERGVLRRARRDGALLGGLDHVRAGLCDRAVQLARRVDWRPSPPA